MNVADSRSLSLCVCVRAGPISSSLHLLLQTPNHPPPKPFVSLLTVEQNAPHRVLLPSDCSPARDNHRNDSFTAGLRDRRFDDSQVDYVALVGTQ